MSNPATNKVTSVKSLHFGTPDIATARRFYTDVWGLRETAEDNGTVYLAGSGPTHHLIALSPADTASLRAITMGTGDRDDIEALHAAIPGAGGTTVTPPAALDGPAGGYGFTFDDPEGRRITIACDQAENDDQTTVPDRPRKISHVILNADQNEISTAFFIDTLGFKLTDVTKGLDFLRCTSDHHSIGIARWGGPTLNHVAFEMPSWEAVMRGVGRMKDAGYAMEWGPGRHGPGNNVFAYFVGPDDVAVEYTAEVNQIDDATHKVGQPEDWDMGPGRHDHWGIAGPPSERLKTAFKHLPFEHLR